MPPAGTDGPLGALFSAALGLSALLFGVFGFLYTLYATHVAQLTGPDAAPILPRLRTICRLLSVLVAVTVAATAAATVGMGLSGLARVLAWVLVGVTATAAALTAYLAFRTMGQ